jgi:hypothetical protein
MPVEEAVRWVEAIGRCGWVEVLAVTGGEPFLDRNRLRILLETAVAFGLKTSVVTSACWGRSYDAARRALRHLPLTNLTFSADKYHVDFIPLDYVRNAARAALDTGIEVGAFLCLENGSDPFAEELRDFLGDELFSKMRIIRQYVHLAGRAERSARLAARVERSPLSGLPRCRCTAVSAPIILTDGTVMACCGDTVADSRAWASLRLGNIKTDSLANLFDKADRNQFIQALRVLGPAELAARAAADLGSGFFSRAYETHSICDICRDIATDRKMHSYVERLLEQPQIRDEVALGRLLLFGEEPVAEPDTPAPPT